MSRNLSREESLFADALALPPAERGAFLAKACGANVDLLAHLVALIAAHEGPDSLTPADFSPAESSARDVANADAPAVAITKTDLSPVALAKREEKPGGVIGRNKILQKIGEDAALSSEAKAGDCIARYKLLQKIGEGGCGVVWMAEQEEPVRRRVALKVIKLGMDTKAVVARFEAERQALAMMDHPCIAKVHDAGSTDTGRPYFVMELVRGIPITKYCDENHLTPKDRLALFIKVCQAIQHAHQKGVIHRDIKPSNILVTVNDGAPTPKVIDFGIAKATQGKLTDATVFTAFEQFIGTPVYMSPEQAEMSSLDIDTRSDVYSLGVLLYELLTGKPPFDPKAFAQAGVDQIRKQIREVEPPRPSARLRTLDDEERTTIARLRGTAESQLSIALRGDLDWIVMRCIEKDRTRRYDTANGLAMDIQRYLRSEPVVARPPSTAYLLQKLIRRHRFGFAATVAVLAAVVAGGIISTWQAIRAKRAEREQIALREAAQESQAKEAELRVRAVAQELATRERAYAADMQLAQQALALDNLVRAQELLDRHRPFPDQRDLRGWEWRHLWQLSRPDYVRQLGRKFGFIRSISLSHDGKWLAVADRNSRALSILNIGTGEELLVPGIPNSVRVAFAPAGPLLAASASGRGDGSRLTGHRIILWNLETRQIVRELPTGGPCGGIRFSRDAQTLVVSAQSPADKITVWRVADGAMLSNLDAAQWDDQGNASPFAVTADGSLAAHPMLGQQLRVIRLSTGDEHWRSTEAAEKGSEVASLAFSPDGKLLATGVGLAAASIRLWDVATGKLIRRFDGHRRWICGLEFSPDGSTLFSASADLTIGSWDVATGSLRTTLRGHKLEVWRLAALNNTALISGGKDGFVYLWDTTSRDRGAVEFQFPKPIATWRFGADSESLLTIDYDGSVTLHRGRTFAESHVMMELGPVVPMGSEAVPENQITPGQISPDLRLIAIPRNKPEPGVEVWDAVTRKLSQRFGAAKNVFPTAVFHDDRTLRVFVDRSADAIICREWDLLTGTEKRHWKLPTPGSGYLRITLSPSGQKILMTRSNAAILHDLATGSHAKFNIEMDARRFPQFSSDGSRLATSIMGRQVAKLWDLSTYREIATLPSTMSVPHSAAFSPDGRRLAVGAGDREAITLWDTNTHEPLLALNGDGTMFVGTQFSPDGNVLASRNLLFPEGHGVLHLWRAPSWAEIEAAEKVEATRRRDR